MKKIFEKTWDFKVNFPSVGLFVFILVSLYAFILKDFPAEEVGEFFAVLVFMAIFFFLFMKTIASKNRRLESLNNELKKFQLAVENASDAIVITDVNKKILYANKAITEMTGFTNEEILGETPVLWGKNMSKEFYEKLWHTIKIEKKTFQGELRNKRKNGEEFVGDLHITPVLDEKNEILFFVGIQRDITKAKEIERAKSEFVSMAAHQLRTPLTTMSLIAEALVRGQKENLDDEGKEYLNDIVKTTQGMSDMIGKFLNVSRIELGLFKVNPAPVNVDQVIENILLEVHQQACEKKISIEKSIPRELPVLALDTNILKLALENILSNSIKYTEQNGLIKVSLQNVDGGIEIVVADTGCGIPKSEQEKIFEKLYRAKNVTKTVKEGLGLGLYVVKSTLEQSGARVWVESEEGRGTEMHIFIPKEGMKELA